MGQPKKIVHVLGVMDIGGIESWLMNILRNNDKTIYTQEFLVQKNKIGYFDDEIAILGGVKHICNVNNKLTYPFRLYKKFKCIKPDVVHSHVHHFSGIILTVAWLAGIKVRISHSHTTEKPNKGIKQIYYKLMNLLISLFSTSQLAVSEEAAVALYGCEWINNSKVKIIYCGVDYSKFINPKPSCDYRKELNITDQDIVIGHVGRMEEPKNHKFLIELMKDLVRIDKKYHVIFVGDGSLRQSLENEVTVLGLNGNIHFMGSRPDIPSIMVNAFDIFVFPSLWEGLPLTLIEAQFAGLKCIISDCVTRECLIGKGVYLTLNDKSLWVNEILSFEKQLSIQDFSKNKFSLSASNEILFKEYELKEYKS